MVLVVAFAVLVFGCVGVGTGVGAGVGVDGGVVVFVLVVLVVVLVLVALVFVVFVVLFVVVELAFVVLVVVPVMPPLGIVIPYKTLFFPLVCVILVVGVTTVVEFAFEVAFAAAIIRLFYVLRVSLSSSKYIIITDLRP